MERASSMLLLVSAIAVQAGCAGARVVEPGLANVAAVPLNETIDVHDVIANGHDSCPRARAGEGDPLRYRYPACAGREIAPPRTTLLVTPAAPTEPTNELWNLHLRGLPPCERSGRGSRSSEVALAMCSEN